MFYNESTHLLFKGTLSDTGRRLDVDREHVLYFDSIDEGHSLLLAENIQRCLNSTECQSLLDSGDEAFVVREL